MMKLTDWHPTLDGRPALVVGKGPTAKFINVFNQNTMFVSTLNHAIRIVDRADIAHFVDLEAFVDCAAEVAAKATHLVMPEFPHVKNNPTAVPAELMPELRPYLSKLVIYVKTGRHISKAEPGKIACRYFSAEGLFGVLGTLGFREVYSIGVDGGASYSAQFKDLVPLTNGQKSFDIQMEHLGEIAKHYGFSWKRPFTSESVDPRPVR